MSFVFIDVHVPAHGQHICNISQAIYLASVPVDELGGFCLPLGMLTSSTAFASF